MENHTQIRENQLKMIYSFQQIKERFNPNLKGHGTRIKERIYDNLSKYIGTDGFYLSQEEILFLLTTIQFNNQNPFVQEIHFLIDAPNGTEVEDAIVDSLTGMLIKIVEKFVSEGTCNKRKLSILSQLQEYIAFHGNFYF